MRSMWADSCPSPPCAGPSRQRRVSPADPRSADRSVGCACLILSRLSTVPSGRARRGCMSRHPEHPEGCSSRWSVATLPVHRGSFSTSTLRRMCSQPMLAGKGPPSEGALVLPTSESVDCRVPDPSPPNSLGQPNPTVARHDYNPSQPRGAGHLGAPRAPVVQLSHLQRSS